MKTFLTIAILLVFQFTAQGSNPCEDQYDECMGWAYAYVNYDIDTCQTKNCLYDAQDMFIAWKKACKYDLNACTMV